MFRNVYNHVRNVLKRAKEIKQLAVDAMSDLTSLSFDSTGDGEPGRKRRRKEFSYAVLLAYQGKKYNGMQVQKEFPTIEGELFKAMASCGYIAKDDVLSPVRFGFQRAARTDRSVSAARQMCSIRLSPENHEEFMKTASDELNRHLPNEIRVLGIRRAIRTFKAHKDCDKRTYSYTLPTFSFAKADELTTSAFRMNDTSIAELNDLLSIFKGTHNFFNYTSGRTYEDRSSMRYIHDFKCGPTQLVEDSIRGDLVEFITLYITGQSFMLHQIRKMIGMTIATVRGLCGKAEIEKTFSSERMDIPKAPGLGLVLDKVHYERYDKRYEKTHEKLNYWGEEIEAKANEFRQCHIIREICEQELATHSMFLWLTTLVRHDITLPDITRNSHERSPLGQASDLAYQANEELKETEINEKHYASQVADELEGKESEEKRAKEIDSAGNESLGEKFSENTVSLSVSLNKSITEESLNIPGSGEEMADSAASFQ